jgi:hypothetical protein
MVDLKQFGFDKLGNCWIFQQGIYTIMHSKKTVSNALFQTKNYIDVLELYVENNDGECILLGEIEGEESLKTILNLIKYER